MKLLKLSARESSMSSIAIITIGILSPLGAQKSLIIVQCKIIVYSTCIDYTTDASGLLAKELTSQHDYVICFVLTESNSIYCVTKSVNAFKSMESHEDNNFVNKL